MSKRLTTSIIALAFLVLIQSFSQVFRFLLPAMIIYIAAVMAYNYWLLKSNNLFSFWSWLRPFFLISSIIGLYFIIPINVFRGLFLLAAIVLIYFVELWLLTASEQLVFLQTLIAYFGLAFGIFGLNFYLLPRNTITLFLLGAMTFVICRSSFDYIPQNNNTKNFFSALIAFCILELSWGLVFLPIHFSALAIILFNIFYVLWIVIYYHLFHNLTGKKISFHLIFSTLIIILVFIATPWKI